jgi:hypothetical protein
MKNFEMRLLYQPGQNPSAIPKPIGRYVYCWEHGSMPRYVGKGINGRWSDHLNNTDPNDRNGNRGNRFKMRYFRRHGAQMRCWIAGEDLSDERCYQLEDQLIRKYGLRRAHGSLRDFSSGTRNRDGILLNDRYGSPVPPQSTNRKGINLGRRVGTRVKPLLRDRIAPNALVYRTTPHNPKQSTGSGWAYIEYAYPTFGTAMKLADLLVKGREHPQLRYDASEQYGHIIWDLTRGVIGFLPPPDGEAIAPGYIVPTWDWLHARAMEVATPEEWQLWCSRAYGKIGAPFPGGKVLTKCT